VVLERRSPQAIPVRQPVPLKQTVAVKRVLIIEHDSLHRDLLREWLEACGACPVWPRAGLEAPGDIDALLVDVACQQQAHEILPSWRRAYPRAAIVLASGRFTAGDTGNDAMALRLGATRILAKPFTRGELCTALGLGSESSPGDRWHR
jgi:DNA-binding response OmpR family regulator